MKSVLECTVLTMSQNESKKTPGTFYSNVTVMQGEEVLKFGCENSLIEKLKPHKMKTVKLVLNVSEWENKPIVKAVDISL